jgi:hypothetical protein
MISFSCKVKAYDLNRVIEMVQIAEKAHELFSSGQVDADWFCEFAGKIDDLASDFGVKVNWKSLISREGVLQ